MLGVASCGDGGWNMELVDNRIAGDGDVVVGIATHAISGMLVSQLFFTLLYSSELVDQLAE